MSGSLITRHRGTTYCFCPSTLHTARQLGLRRTTRTRIITCGLDKNIDLCGAASSRCRPRARGCLRSFGASTSRLLLEMTLFLPGLKLPWQLSTTTALCTLGSLNAGLPRVYRGVRDSTASSGLLDTPSGSIDEWRSRSATPSSCFRRGWGRIRTCLVPSLVRVRVGVLPIEPARCSS